MIRGVGFAGSGYLLSRVITLISFVVLARLITPEELGQYTAGSILVGIGLLLAGGGMVAALIHRRDRLDEAASTATVATTLAGALAALLGLAVSPLIGLFFGSDTVTAVAAACSGILFIQAARSVPNAILQRQFSFLRRLVVEPAAAVAFGVVAIVATSSGLGVWGLVAGQYASSLVDLALSWGLVRWRPRLRQVSFSMWRELIEYGRHVLAGSAVRRLGDRVPILVAGGMLSTSAVGQLQYANRIVTTPYALLVAGISYVIFPAFSRISSDPARFKPAFLRSLRWATLVAMPIGLILAPLGEPLAILAFGERWREAGEVTAAVCLFIPAQTIAAVTGEGFKGIGLPAQRTRVNLIGVITGAAAMLALTPAFGLYGVGAGISIDALAGAAAAVALAVRMMDMPLRPILRSILPQAAAALIMIAILFPLENLVVDAASHGTLLGLLLLTAEGALGFGIYFACMRFLAPGLGRELLGMLRTARRKPAERPGELESDEELLEDEGEPMLPG